MINKNLIIVGSGAAGLSAAIYSAGRYLIPTLVIGEEEGGTTVTAGKIENYPGVLPIEGWKLMGIMKQQAKEAGAEILIDKIEKIEKNEKGFHIIGKKQEYQAKSVIYATGNKWRKLGLTNEKELTGKGVHYCVVCDGPLYKNKKVAIIGGGDSSVKAGWMLAEFAEKVFLITREDDLIAEPVNLKRLKDFGDKVEIISNTTIKEIKGTEKLESLLLDKNGIEETLEISGLFIEIGADPNIDAIKDLGVEFDEGGHIKSEAGMKTKIPGFFVAGDVSNCFGKFKQVIGASASGAVSASSVNDFLKIGN